MDPTSLPEDILILVLELLGVNELVTLSLTCRTMHTIVTTIGWPSYLRTQPRPSFSLTKARSLWSPRIRVLYDIWTDSAWSRSEFIARPLSRTWRGKLQPVLAISPSRLIVGAGSNLYSYAFNASSSNATSPSVIFEGVISLLGRFENERTITALTFIDDGGFDRTLHVAFQDGAIERVLLTQSTSSHVNHSTSLSAIQTNLNPMAIGDFVESLSSEANSILTLSSTGYVSLSDLRSEHTNSSSSTIELNTRSWIAHLCLQSSTPYAAFGTSSSTPLIVHSITDSQISPRPFAVLHTSKSIQPATDRPHFSAVYGLSRGPLNSPWGSSPQILVSGWFDGNVRCYDLRSSSRTKPISGEPCTPAPLRPVLSLADRWSNEPIYSVSCGGGSASYIAAGTARHSVVSFWDVRSPKNGWSVHAPGNDPSPVYSVVLESSRFFGATQSRPFVYDFGPGVTMDTYPPIPPIRGIDNLKQRKGSNRATYHVLSYPHKGSGLGSEH